MAHSRLNQTYRHRHPLPDSALSASVAHNPRSTFDAMTKDFDGMASHTSMEAEPATEVNVPCRKRTVSIMTASSDVSVFDILRQLDFGPVISVHPTVLRSVAGICTLLVTFAEARFATACIQSILARNGTLRSLQGHDFQISIHSKALPAVALPIGLQKQITLGAVSRIIVVQNISTMVSHEMLADALTIGGSKWHGILAMETIAIRQHKWADVRIHFDTIKNAARALQKADAHPLFVASIISYDGDSSPRPMVLNTEFPSHKMESTLAGSSEESYADPGSNTESPNNTKDITGFDRKANEGLSNGKYRPAPLREGDLLEAWEDQVVDQSSISGRSADHQDMDQSSISGRSDDHEDIELAEAQSRCDSARGSVSGELDVDTAKENCEMHHTGNGMDRLIGGLNILNLDANGKSDADEVSR